MGGTPVSGASVAAGRLRRFARRSSVDEIEPRLVWIFGSPRSGSTWLLKLLGGLDEVVPVNEPLIGAALGQIMADVKGVSADGFDSGNFVSRRMLSGKRDAFFAEEFRDVWLPALGDLMRRRFHAHAERHPSSVPASRALVAIKEPNGSQSADVIMAALPRARLLFLLRDGRDVIDSELAAMQPGAWVSQLYPGIAGIGEDQRLEWLKVQARKWLWRTEVVQEAYEAHRGPKLLVRYEELLADTVPGMRSILDWLGVEMEDAALAELVRRRAFDELPKEARGDKAFFRAASPGLWRENLSAEEQRAVAEIIGPKLRELGYDA